MDSNNWRPAQTEGPPPIDGGDWRSQLQPDSRSRIVNKIMETLKRHLPFSGQEGLQELKQIAIRFEEKIYSAATSQSDYLRKISLKMLTMESKSQAAPSNATGVSRNPQDSVPSQSMQSQLPSQSQSVSLQMASNQAQTRQQLLGQNMQSNNIVSSGMQPTANLPNALPSSTMSQNALPNVPQNISGISQSSMGNTMNQGVASNMFSNAPRQQQMQGRQLTQQVGSQQHQQQSQNAQQLMYQQQLMKQKVQQAGNMQPLMQAQLQQQPPPSQPQQNLLQANQQPMMQTSSVMQPSMLPGLPQNQQSLQQPSQSVLQQHQQSAMRQQQQTQQTPIIQQQQTQAQQQSMMSSQAQHSQQQQQPLMGQQPNDANMQQSQLLGQQSNIPDMQQQQRLLGQQNNIQNLPNQQANHQNLQQQQQHMMGQQSNLANMHQQQLGHQSHVGGLPQQQVMGTQSGSTNMQMNQHSLHMLQQPKAPISQQGSLSQGGGQQAQPQLQSQQQLMSQLQSQPRQLQQQLGLQQSTNSLQQNMQPRMQNPNSLLQQQNIFDQQNKLLQAQRPHAEAPTTSLDSTAQTGGTSGGDWQEEVYQKIKNMKDMYYADLNDMYQKISIKLQQNESLPQGPKADQVDKLRLFKNMLEKLMQVLQTTKNNILPTHKEKLPSFEKQIISLLSSNRARRPVPSMQSGQILPQMQSMQQLHQSHSQISQPQSHEVGVNPQLQSMNLQGSVAPMQQSNVPNLQHGSVPSLSAISASQQSMAGPGSLQNNSNLESGQGNTPSSMQQVAMTSLQKNSASAPQQANITSLQSQTDASMLQPNINSHQSNSNTLQNQIMQNPQFKQQLQNRHLQQQLIHKQFQQQHVKQQQASQIAAHQMPQLHQTDVNEKMRQNLALRPGTFPQHLSSAQRFAHQQLKSGGASFPVSSPQLLQVVSPQISHPSPQIEQQTLQQSVVKSGTPLQSANSPFVPSPSTPLAPSPMPGDSEKPAVSSLSNAANVGNQHGGIPAATQSLSIGTPGISPSPLFECVGPEGNQGNSSAVSGKSSLTEQPLDRLLKAVNSISPKALEAAVCDIRSVVSMIDRIAGSAPGNGSRATVGEDLVALTKCRLQARNFLTQDGNTGTKRMRRYTRAMPLNDVTTVGSMNDSLMLLAVSETSELESPANSNKKRVKTEVNHALLEEIREINERLIDTVVDVSDEEMDPFIAASAHEGSEGTIVRCSYSAVSLSPDLKAHYSSAQVSQIQPLRLLVPLNYPNCSPILLDNLPVDVSNEHEDLSVKAKSRFSISLRSLSQPMSLKEIARTWDHCTRAVICEYAQKSGGGTFSSKYGTWEKCSSAA